MFTLTPLAGRLLNKVATLAFTGYFSIFSVIGGTGVKPPKADKDFTPVVRFVVCSDTHLSGSDQDRHAVKFKDMFTDAYAYSEQNEKYQNLDAVIVAGDFTARGSEDEYQCYNSITENYMKDGTQLLTCLGNHEFHFYRDYDPTIGYTTYKKYISENVNTHVVINGFHFIGVSYDDDGAKFKNQAKWLKAELDKAVKDDPTKPIFVFQHPSPTLTIYGSLLWSDITIKAVLEKYPQVIDFSGHSHYNPADPRVINQGTFTSVGTGAVSGSMSNTEYLTGGNDAPENSGTFWIAEVDADGNTRLQLYDVVNHEFFSNVDYYLTDITNLKNRPYTWGNSKSFDTTPKFDSETKITLSQNEDGENYLNFSCAKGYYKTAEYQVTVYNNIFDSVWSQTVMSESVYAIPTQIKVNIGKLESGTYKVKITPISPYAKYGEPLKGTITVE